MYEKQYDVRFRDLSSGLTVTLPAVVDLLQDISIYHSASVGFDLKTLYQRHIAWLLQGWCIRLLQPMTDAVPIRAVTGICKMHAMNATRFYELWQNGVLTVQAKASWFTFQDELMQPCLIPDDLRTAYGAIDPDPTDFSYQRLRAVESFSEQMAFTVLRRDMDTNLHLNNVKSVEMLLEVLPESFQFNEIQITYRSPAMYGERLSAGCVKTENGVRCELRKADGMVCVAANFLKM